MSGFGALRARWGRARMAMGKCGELRRRERSRRDGPVFVRPEEAPPGPGFGSWF
ncbi:hypothetical protein AB0K52_24985 [Glycomyces sp. NPDC049804]|uniref:hypothetical protein n=1 Tax=Glycomyces sp. NPDC049804 TaxID=3154363 RepID=UPI00343BFF12